VSREDLLAVNAAIIGERPTGLGLYAARLIESLDALGERLLVYTSRPDLLAVRTARLVGTPAAGRPERGAGGHVLRLLWTQTGLRMRVRRDRPRLLLNLFPEGLLWPAVPQVTIVHDLLPLQYPAEYPRQQHYFRHYVPAVLRQSRAVIVSSESTRRDVLERYRLPAEKVHVVHCGYDPRRFTPGPTRTGGEPYGLYVGNVMPHKNLLRVVEAFARLGPGPRLVIRGSGRVSHVRALRARITSLGIASRVDWQAYAPDAELLDLYRGARLLVVPSLYEGFGLPALEAMACGTPVLTSCVSSLPEVVGDAAILVDPTDTDAISAALARLFDDDVLAKELAERGLARSRMFSWEKTGQGVCAVLRRTLEET